MNETSDYFLVFLDRDGTIIKDKHYLADPDGVELLDGAVEGLQNIQALGGILVVVTNQSGIGRGFFDRPAADAVNSRLREVLEVKGVRLANTYTCPHSPTDSCECRKPRSSLFEEAATVHGLPLDKSYVIGDRPSDVEAGRRIGASSILIEAPRRDSRYVNGTWIVRNLLQASLIIARTLLPE